MIIKPVGCITTNKKRNSPMECIQWVKPKKTNIMKSKIITAVLLLSAFVLGAQTTNQPASVRIKKVENINGVEKTTDTTFVTNDPSSIKIDNGTINIEEIKGEDGKMIKTIVIDGDQEMNEEIQKAMKEAGKGNMKMKTIIIDDGNGKGKLSEKEMEEMVNNAMRESGVEPAKGGESKMVIINNDSKGSDNLKGEHRITKMVVLKCDLSSCSEEDMKRINKQAGTTDGQLKVEKMNFFPNPSTGKFNLSFDLPERGDTEIMIMNMEGRSVYSEKLSNFSGNYNKEIDISKNAKGVYFVRVEQGKHAQVKKIVLE
jgi:hypothetical protein